MENKETKNAYAFFVSFLLKTPPSRVVGQSEPCRSGRCPRDGFTAPNVRCAVETSQSMHALGRSANHRLP